MTIRVTSGAASWNYIDDREEEFNSSLELVFPLWHNAEIMD